MKTKHLAILFGAMVIIQCAIPLGMIVRREIVLRTGAQYRFKTEPVDPYDAFRGRYVALSVSGENKTVPEGKEYFRGQRLYAAIGEDSEGFAELTELSEEKPGSGDFIAVTVSHMLYNTNIVRLTLPFDRYYMNEKDAPEAERAYRRHSSREKHDAYINVRVKSGFTVLESLYIGGKPVEEFLKEQGRGKGK